MSGHVKDLVIRLLQMLLPFLFELLLLLLLLLLLMGGVERACRGATCRSCAQPDWEAAEALAGQIPSPHNCG